MSAKCKVCSEKDQKYKCPKCETPYCSVSCYKTHQNNCSNTEGASEFSIDNKGSQIDIDLDEELIDPSILAKLGESAELLGLLKNYHLREYLQYINETYNPRGFMKLAMQEPLFVEFSNACLKVLHPELVRDEITAEEFKEAVEEAIENQ